jgi:hypothetical protein
MTYSINRVGLSCDNEHASTRATYDTPTVLRHVRATAAHVGVLPRLGASRLLDIIIALMSRPRRRGRKILPKQQLEQHQSSTTPLDSPVVKL